MYAYVCRYNTRYSIHFIRRCGAGLELKAKYKFSMTMTTWLEPRKDLVPIITTTLEIWERRKRNRQVIDVDMLTLWPLKENKSKSKKKKLYGKFHTAHRITHYTEYRPMSFYSYLVGGLGPWVKFKGKSKRQVFDLNSNYSAHISHSGQDKANEINTHLLLHRLQLTGLTKALTFSHDVTMKSIEWEPIFLT